MSDKTRELMLKVRDGSSYSERLAAFADLPIEVQRDILNQPGTISSGAESLIGPSEVSIFKF